MKREEILFYLATGKIYVYLLNSKREYIENLDTSLFFKYGEISNVERCSEAITKFTAKMNFGLYYLKPGVIVLYNDVCYSDAKFLYKNILSPIGYHKISFVPLTKLASKIRDDDNLVVSDKDYYTLVKKCEKRMSLKSLDFEPIILGDTDNKHIHYSDEEILWRTFKSCFTKGPRYDMMDVGDD